MKKINLIFSLFYISFNCVVAQADSVEIKRYDDSLGGFSLDYFNLLKIDEFGKPFLFRREFYTKDSVLSNSHQMNSANETSVSHYFDKEGRLIEFSTDVKDDYYIRIEYYPAGGMKYFEQFRRTGEEWWEQGKDGWQLEYNPEGEVIKMCLYKMGEVLECSGYDDD